MFFANALKDYADQLNDLAVFFHDNFTFFVFLKSLFVYLFNSVKLGLVYIFSFQWLTDFIELPCNFKFNYISILKGDNLAETYVNPTFFEFLEPKAINSNPFLTGIFNSFFLALPLSVPHLLAFRAFLMNGLPAGIISAAGTILGQFTFFICVLFGFESILMPFLTFEPFNYIFGFILVINVLYTITHNSNREVLNIKLTQDLKVLINFFFLNFALAWTEQTSLFQYFGNLTASTLPTLLQGTEKNLTIFSDFFLPTTFYLVGILVGSAIWTAFFGFLVTFFFNFVSQVFQIPYLFLNERTHKLLLVLTFTFCFTSVPYYGFDYLVSAPLGFLSQDKALNFLKATTYYSVETAEREPAILYQQAVNPIPFDRPSQMEKTFKPDFFLYNFEDSSIDPENFWKNQNYRDPRSSAFQTAQKSKAKNQVDEEILFREQVFKKAFYKSSSDAVLQMKSPKPLENFERNIDKLALKLFSPVAYDYYNINKSPLDENKKVVRQQFRERFYKNPVYKALVNLDMIGFLQCQPSAYNLTAKEEEFLFLQRIILQNYLNSVSEYKTISTKTATSTSYAEKVYNQQFKGSLDLVRHYFSIDLASPTDLNLFENFGKVLKFDQPLYKNSLNETNPFLHEELNFKLQENEELDFIPLIDSTPFYIGWDSSLRKFLVKNSCTPGLPQGTESLPIISKNISSKYPTYLSFQSWPDSESDLKKLVDKNVSLAFIPITDENLVKTADFLGLQNFQYTKKTDSKNTNLLIQKNLPSYDWKWVLTSLTLQEDLLSKPAASKNVISSIDLGNTLPPQLDGFSWPGAFGLEKLVGLKLNEFN
uniref:Hypothetical chloroplast RF1 n=1 Tax=Gloeotilopsis planctonica TaxID=34157 RepID=A0A1B2RZ74_9CHLO|nr:hypothetical chloroplast RF1 [Gloeotilopsis planctonica]